MQVNQGNLTQSSEDLFITGKYLNSFCLIISLFFFFSVNGIKILLTELVNFKSFKSRRQSLPPLRIYDYQGIFNCVLSSSLNLNASSVCLMLWSPCCLSCPGVTALGCALSCFQAAPPFCSLQLVFLLPQSPPQGIYLVLSRARPGCAVTLVLSQAGGANHWPKMGRWQQRCVDGAAAGGTHIETLTQVNGFSL